MEQAEERRSGERRKYNRRSEPGTQPPYFEVFERIALALEQISATMPRVTSVDVREPVAPRRAKD